MRHQVDIFQQQLQYETLAAATTLLMLQAAATTTLMSLMLASHLQRDGWATPQSLKLLTPEDMVQMNILPRHRRLMVDTLKDLELLVLGLVGCQPFFLVGPESTGGSFATHCALKHKFHQHHLS